MATKANDSTTVTNVQATFSIIEKSKNLKLCKLHPVVKYDKSNSGHRKAEISKFCGGDSLEDDTFLLPLVSQITVRQRLRL
ncbi:hypothetical protein FNV43_RR01035 [Rhamnella rubrinervis]|uniref:Uncharacterized protein n=1 Tax=Rhamnella rubrinervis TaxID=2594499 RepID=A0A8K0HPS3_9ROSA|nr:hypothetical protein FNV43_RR01035 [Rhamnella rubrinervis]